MSKPRYRDSSRARRICIDHYGTRDALGVYMLCAAPKDERKPEGPKCGARIDPVRKPKGWQADHYPIKWTDGGEDKPENLRPICEACWPKVNGDDWTEISHGKRMSDKHNGDRQSKGWRW